MSLVLLVICRTFSSTSDIIACRHQASKHKSSIAPQKVHSICGLLKECDCSRKRKKRSQTIAPKNQTCSFHQPRVRFIPFAKKTPNSTMEEFDVRAGKRTCNTTGSAEECDDQSDLCTRSFCSSPLRNHHAKSLLGTWARSLYQTSGMISAKVF